MLHTMEEEQALKTENKMMWLTECFAGSLVLTFDASSVQAHPCAKSYVFQGSQTKNKVSLEVKSEKMCKYFHLHASFGGPISICGKKVSRKLTILNRMWLLVLFLFTLDICGGEKKNIFALNLSSTGAQPCWQNRSDLWNQCNEKEENKDTLVLSVKIVCLGAKRWTDNKRRRK